MNAAASSSRLRLDLLTIGLIGVVYALNKNPFLGWNDALSFVDEAMRGWSPYTNATSHFLYTNTLHVLFSIFGFLNPVFIATSFSVICGLLCTWRMKDLARMMGASDAGGRLIMIVWGLSFTFWQQAEGVEVYAFNCLIASHFLFFALKDMMQGEQKHWIGVSVLMGMGLLTHIQWILAIPFFGYYLLLSVPRISVSKTMGAILITGGLASMLFWLPLMTGLNTVSAVFFDNRFKGDVLGLDPLVLMKGFVKGIGFAVYNFHLFCIPILLGWWQMFKNKHALRWPLLLFLVPFWGFAAKYGVSDNHVFYLLAYMVLVLPMGIWLGKWLEKGTLRGSIATVSSFAFPVILYAMTTFAVRQTNFGKQYDQEKAYKGGATHICWPGKAWAKDPLALAREYLENDPGAFERGEIEWNYPAAAAIVQRTENIHGEH